MKLQNTRNELSMSTRKKNELVQWKMGAQKQIAEHRHREDSSHGGGGTSSSSRIGAELTHGGGASSSQPRSLISMHQAASSVGEGEGEGELEPSEAHLHQLKRVEARGPSIDIDDMVRCSTATR